MLSGGYPSDQGRTGEDGRATDILAEKVNLGSGRTYERAKPAVKKITIQLLVVRLWTMFHHRKITEHFYKN
jgi:hypothetical protein